MARYFNYRRHRSFNYYPRKESQRSEAKEGLVGIDDDVLRIFSGLIGINRTNLFIHYEKAHGRPKANYARETMSDWANGTVKASGPILTRLLALVPKVLDENQRYDLLKKLYDGHRGSHQESHSLTVVVGHSLSFRQHVTDMGTRLCKKPDTHTLPKYVQEKIDWVCDNDSAVARKIMAAIETDYSMAIAAAGSAEVENLVSRIQSLDMSAEGTHTITFPYGVITVYVRKPNFFEKITKFFS